MDSKAYNVDPANIKAHITDKTKADVAVDFTMRALKFGEIKNSVMTWLDTYRRSITFYWHEI